MTVFYLIRHAHCDAIGKKIAGRKPGIHLSAEGRLQAERLADRLAKMPMSFLLCSPLERAYETAEPIAVRLNLKIQIADFLTEIDYGAWAGSALSELQSDPQWRRFNRFRSWIRIPGGEMIGEVQFRMVNGIEALRREHPDAEIGIVSHGDPIKTLLAYALGMPLEFLFRFEIAPASVSTLIMTEDGVLVKQLNGTINERFALRGDHDRFQKTGRAD